MAFSKEQVLTALAHVIHPHERRDLVSLDMIQDLIVQEKYISFTLEMPEKHDSLANELIAKCEEVIHQFIDPEAIVDVVVGINISMRRKLEEGPVDNAKASRPALDGVKHIIAVASGKGGVGKSTVAANIASVLAHQGYAVGLMDTDIYGPSVPTMFNVFDKPDITVTKKLVPIRKYGIKLVSMGFLVDVNQAMVWRGPMVSSAVRQFMNDVAWGDLDYMVLDLPPGTGDIQLTIVQSVPLSGAVIVSTPQIVALDDVRKGVNMFNKVNVPVLGVVENMSYFIPPDLPDKKYFIFGEGGASRLANELNIPVLGEVPLEQPVRESGDVGLPIVLADETCEASKAFRKVTENILKTISEVEGDEQPSIDIKWR